MSDMTPGQKAAATRKARRAAQASQPQLAAPIASKLTGLCIRIGDTFRDATRDEVMDAAAQYLLPEARGRMLATPSDSIDFFRALCAGRQHETFAIAFLDTRHRVITVEALFKGTIDGATVYPREVVRRALEVGASAVILAHNHPSGIAEPSEADRSITLKLAKALSLVEIRMLDHVIVTNASHVSMGERGLI
jgi:DNA repair protein RadC